MQQQVTLALCRIYTESRHCGRVYCDGDSPERIARVKQGWATKIREAEALRAQSSRDLLQRFVQEKVFWRQFEIGRALAATGDNGVISQLEPLLADEDRHRRGNVAFVLGRLGDPRGFDVIVQMLRDLSPRSVGQGIPGGTWTVRAQIRADRYYAAHLFGDLKDSRAVPVLMPLLTDKDVADIVPWALAEIGDHAAIPALMQMLDQKDPSRRVLAIDALETLRASEAIPKLRELLGDDRKANFGQGTTVMQAAQRAIQTLSEARKR